MVSGLGNSSVSDNDGPNRAREVTCATLKALNLVDQMRGSVRDFEDVLAFAKELYCKPPDCNLEEYWPKNWRDTQKLLKDCGYKDPKELFICLDDSHYAQWDVMDSPNATCRYCGKVGKIKYCYLGLCDKIERWCSDAAMCSKMMAHWENKGHWIYGCGPNQELKEIWDGSRFNELKWFWDPQAQWMLPSKCPFCETIFSVEEIKASREEDGFFSLHCTECGTQHKYKPRYARGDPQNIAFIGHLDGWQPFGSPGSHSCGKF